MKIGQRRPMHLWPNEVLALALLMWSRIAKFRDCQRRVPPPVYLYYVQQWHEWETQAVKKQLGVQVAEELHGPSLLRRMLHKWGRLPSVQQHERAVERLRADEDAHLRRVHHLALERTCRVAGGSPRLLQASAQRMEALGALAQARERRRVCGGFAASFTAMGQHFEIHTAHPMWSLNTAATVRRGAQGIAAGGVAREAAFLLQREPAQAVAVAFRGTGW